MQNDSKAQPRKALRIILRQDGNPRRLRHWRFPWRWFTHRPAPGRRLSKKS